MQWSPPEKFRAVWWNAQILPTSGSYGLIKRIMVYITEEQLSSGWSEKRHFIIRV